MADRISRPGQYSGYSEAVYDGWQRFSEYVTMRDGVKIAVDYYRPTKTGILEETPLPVVWVFTPYDYRTIFATGRYIDGTEFTSDCEEDIVTHARLLSSHGYVFAMGEVRGTGVSSGFRQSVNSKEEAADGYEVCEWLAAQSWCDGNVGTFGFSYFGATQMEMLRKCPPSLKASFIGMTDLDKYNGWVRGGVLRAFGTQPDAAYLEDLKNVPVLTEGQTQAEQETARRQAVLQHRFSSMQGQIMKDCPYRDSWSADADERFWEYVSHSSYLDDINRADTAIYLYGGWRDVFRRETILMFRNLRGAVKLLFGPWSHMDNRPGFDLGAEKLRFFDYYLKGIDNGLTDEPRVFYSLGSIPGTEEWACADTWPVPGTTERSLFLSEGRTGTVLSVNDGFLSFSAPDSGEGHDVYTVDYDIQENVDNDTKTADRDAKGLTYTGEPLPADLKAIGHPVMNLWISSSADDGDFFVHLVDVDEDGNGTYVTDGILRASLRAVAQPPYDNLDLPWHPCRREDEHKLTPGTLYRLQIDLQPTSYVFRKGHRIRVTITCACRKILFRQQDPAPVVSVYRDAAHASYITLPVVQ